MSSLQLQAQNIKCAGCATNIKNGLVDIAGIDSVEVDIPSGTVRIEGSEPDLTTITAKLAELGYPIVQD